jgi:large subunit ribosomal protein L21
MNETEKPKKQEKSEEYAVIRTGGKQYRVKRGQRLVVEKLDTEAGKEVVLSDVLYISGKAAIAKNTAQVKATVAKHLLGDKINIFKKRRTKGYKKHQGHRQQLTEIHIQDISVHSKEKNQ